MIKCMSYLKKCFKIDSESQSLWGYVNLSHTCTCTFLQYDGENMWWYLWKNLCLEYSHSQNRKHTEMTVSTVHIWFYLVFLMKLHHSFHLFQKHLFNNCVILCSYPPYIWHQRMRSGDNVKCNKEDKSEQEGIITVSLVFSENAFVFWSIDFHS